jgi:hypothetical protein
MKKLTMFLALGSLCFSNLAFGILDQGENSLGVYFDPGTFEMNCTDAPYAVPFSMYFVMANCTQSSIGGFEFAWAIDPEPSQPVIALAVVLPQFALNIGDNFNFIVGLGEPLVTGPATVLVEVQLLNLAQDLDSFITVGPVNPSSIPGQTAFVDGIDHDILLPMNYSTLDGVNVNLDENGWVRPGIGMFSCPGPVAVEPSPWGSVKALFN